MRRKGGPLFDRNCHRCVNQGHRKANFWQDEKNLKR